MSIVVVVPTMPRRMSAPSEMPIHMSQLFSRPGGRPLGGGSPLALRGRAAVFWGSISTGPHRGSTINVLDGLLATGRLALATIAQEVRQDHVVPAARWADFDDNNLEFPELMRHLLQLGSPFDPTGVLAQLIAEDVAEHNHFGRLTYRAGTAGRFTVILRRADQQRVGITRVMAGQRAAGALERLEGGATLQRIVDDLALRPHGKQEYVGSRSGAICPSSGPCHPTLARASTSHPASIALSRSRRGRPDRWRESSIRVPALRQPWTSPCEHPSVLSAARSSAPVCPPKVVRYPVRASQSSRATGACLDCDHEQCV